MSAIWVVLRPGPLAENFGGWVLINYMQSALWLVLMPAPLVKYFGGRVLINYMQSAIWPVLMPGPLAENFGGRVLINYIQLAILPVQFRQLGAYKLYAVSHMAGSDARCIGRKFWWPNAHKLYSVSARICQPYGWS